uniref:Putative secreted protein n=2 Tax=Anopheles triannulatus TaxID=58253 RepID=A0A2M4ACN1_9DIPT
MGSRWWRQISALLHRALLVNGNVECLFQPQRLVLLAQPIQYLARPQSRDELVQQYGLKVRTELAVHRQLLQSPIPLRHVLADGLRCIVEVCPLAEDGHLGTELLPQQLTQLLERPILGQGWVAQVPQALVGLATDATDQERTALLWCDFVHFEELLQPLVVHVPIVELDRKLRYRAD